MTRRQREQLIVGSIGALALGGGLATLAAAAAEQLADRYATWTLLGAAVAYVVTQLVLIPLMTPARRDDSPARRAGPAPAALPQAWPVPAAAPTGHGLRAGRRGACRLTGAHPAQAPGRVMSTPPVFTPGRARIQGGQL